MIVPELPTLVPSPTCTVNVWQTVEEVVESTVTSAGRSRLSIEKSRSGLPGKLGKFVLGVEPLVVNKPVGGLRGKGLASSILARANTAKSARSLVGLSFSTASGGSAPDAMVVNAWFT